MPRAVPAAVRAGRILAVVRRIPRGTVATYGQVARLAGLPDNARLVGRVLSGLTDERIPWQRVVNARGEVSARAESGIEEDVQRALLELEGVAVDERGRIDLPRFQWRPARAARRSATGPAPRRTGARRSADAPRRTRGPLQ